MIGFLAWQTALGIFIAGVIVGWFLSIGLAYRIARRGDSELWNALLKKDESSGED